MRAFGRIWKPLELSADLLETWSAAACRRLSPLHLGAASGRRIMRATPQVTSTFLTQLVGGILMKDDWPHAPVHRLTPEGVFMVTAATLHKEQIFLGRERLHLLHATLLRLAKLYYW